METTGQKNNRIKKQVRDFLRSEGIDKSDFYAVTKMFCVDKCQYPPKLPVNFKRVAQIAVERWDEFQNYVKYEIDFELMDEIIP